MTQAIVCPSNNRTIPVWASLQTGDTIHYQPSWSNKCYEYLIVERLSNDDFVVLRLPRNGSTARSLKTTLSEARTLSRGFVHQGDALDTYFAKQKRTRARSKGP